MKTGHVFADGPSAEYDRDLYYREVGGSTEARCLACQAWLSLAREGEACPESIRLVVGLKYQIRIADEPEVHTALFVKVPEHQMDAAWYVYDPDRGNAVHPHKYVTVVSVDLEHAFGLWDAIAGAVGPMDASDRYVTGLAHRTVTSPTIDDIADPRADRDVHGPVTIVLDPHAEELGPRYCPETGCPDYGGDCRWDNTARPCQGGREALQELRTKQTVQDRGNRP